MMVEDSEAIDGACHCGGVRFRVRLGGGLRAAFRCDCSYCGMRGAVAVPVALDALTLIAGAELLNAYQFGTHTACHYFCSRCGIHTHYRRRFDPDQYGVSTACLAGVSPFDFEAVPVAHGRIHPADRHDGRRAPRAGTLLFVPASD